MKKLSGYFLMVTGLVLTGLSLLMLVNGADSRENLVEVLITLSGGIISLFSGISLHFPMIASPEKVKAVNQNDYRKPRF